MYEITIYQKTNKKRLVKDAAAGTAGVREEEYEVNEKVLELRCDTLARAIQIILQLEENKPNTTPHA